MSVAQLVKELAKHISLVQLLILCGLNFASQREVTMIEGGLSRINHLSYLSCIPVLPKVFLLPSVIRLHRDVTKLKMYPRFNKALLDIVKIKVNLMADQSKLCCAIFDELAIKETNMSYNLEHDEVKGLNDFRDVGKYKYD